MKKLALVIAGLLIASQALAAETYVDRIRVVFDRLKSSASPLESKMGAAETTRYADPIVNTYYDNYKNDFLDGNGDPIAIENLTNEQKAQIVVKHLRDHVLGIYKKNEVDSAVDTSKSSTNSTVNTQYTIDFGSDES